MRVVLLVLVLANLAFFGWARWIDVPVPQQAAAAVPTLRLANVATAATSAATATGAATGTAAGASAALALAARCRSIGPFPDAASANAAATAMQAARGLTAQSRSVSGTVSDGYWVYLPAIADVAARRRVLARLKAAGVRDAVALVQPDQPEETDRISVGLFTDAIHAQRRAAAVKALGLAPVVEPHQSTLTTYWLNVGLGAGAADPALSDIGNAQGVLRVADSLKVIDCPAKAAAG